jgi:hypothetical protein
MDFEASAKRLDDFIAETLDAHEARLLRSMAALEDNIVSLYARLTVDADGNILGPKWTLAQAQEIHAKMLSVFSNELDREVVSLTDDYAAIGKEVQVFAKSIGLEDAYTMIDPDMLTVLQEQSFGMYQTMTDQTADRIAQAGYDAIVAGQSFATLSHSISAAITGYVDIAGRPMTQYAGTFAHDTLMKYYRTIQEIGGEAANLDYYLYQGDIIRDSREFCIERAGKVFTTAEVDSWNELAPWAGKSGDVWVCCGGYRCRHHLIAVDPEWMK